MNTERKQLILDLLTVLRFESTKMKQEYMLENAKLDENLIAQNVWSYCIVENSKFKFDGYKRVGLDYKLESVYEEGTVDYIYDYIRRFNISLPKLLEEDYSQYLESYYKEV